MWYVYILLCKDKSLYTGFTNNLKKRILDHKNGHGGRYTRSHKVVKLVYQQKFASNSEALKREIQIKGWSRDQKVRTLNLYI